MATWLGPESDEWRDKHPTLNNIETGIRIVGFFALFLYGIGWFAWQILRDILQKVGS